MPAGTNLQADQTEWYVKTPQEMSRYELAELEAELKTMTENPDEEEEIPEEADIAEMKKDP